MVNPGRTSFWLDCLGAAVWPMCSWKLRRMGLHPGIGVWVQGFCTLGGWMF